MSSSPAPPARPQSQRPATPTPRCSARPAASTPPPRPAAPGHLLHRHVPHLLEPGPPQPLLLVGRLAVERQRRHADPPRRQVRHHHLAEGVVRPDRLVDHDAQVRDPVREEPDHASRLAALQVAQAALGQQQRRDVGAQSSHLEGAGPVAVAPSRLGEVAQVHAVAPPLLRVFPAPFFLSSPSSRRHDPASPRHARLLFRRGPQHLSQGGLRRYGRHLALADGGKVDLVVGQPRAAAAAAREDAQAPGVGAGA
ncbi:hypothetical protein VTK73DRAFT_5841 [Phialemonium thermophilum]|uniref:Uncharacterized protein n=1 Tax=Phialemonium thermophilum TaxID=223376 RepID=A0ABR3V0E2_9PEZI